MLTVAMLIALGALVLIWLAYPAVMAILGQVLRREPRRLALPAHRMVSVVLATREDAATVGTRVQDFLRAARDHGSLEMVVAIDAAGAAVVPEQLEDLDPRVRVVAGDAPGGKAATLNAGVRAASGEVIVFTDTHQRFDPDSIPRLAAALEDPAVGAASGSLELPADGGRKSLVELYWRFERWLRRSEARVHSSVGVTGAIYAVRRTDWQPLPPGLILDDVFVPMRLVLGGFRVAWVEDARAWETRRFTWAQEYRRKVRTLTGNIQLCVWLPGVLLPHRNPIWLQFVFHKLLRLLSPYLCIIIAAWVALRSAGWLGDLRAPAVVAGGAILLLGLLSAPRVGRPVRALAMEGAILQAAVLVATVNGLRGRWNVWSR